MVSGQSSQTIQKLVSLMGREHNITKIGISTVEALNGVRSMAKDNIHGQIQVPMRGNGKMIKGRMVREHTHLAHGAVTLENLRIVRCMAKGNVQFKS